MMEVRFSAEGIQAMDLMENVHPANVCFGSESKALRPFGSLRWILAQLKNVVLCNRYWVHVGDFIPCGIDLFAWWLSEYWICVWHKQSAIELLSRDFDVQIIKQWSFSTSAIVANQFGPGARTISRNLFQRVIALS